MINDVKISLIEMTDEQLNALEKIIKSEKNKRYEISRQKAREIFVKAWKTLEDKGFGVYLCGGKSLDGGDDIDLEDIEIW